MIKVMIILARWFSAAIAISIVFSVLNVRYHDRRDKRLRRQMDKEISDHHYDKARAILKVLND